MTQWLRRYGLWGPVFALGCVLEMLAGWMKDAAVERINGKQEDE